MLNGHRRDPKLVLIAIQARSTSTRLPGKATRRIRGKRILDHVIENCKKSADFTNRRYPHLRTKIVVLTPLGDSIATDFRSVVDILEGPEQDVLARYGVALQRYTPDLMVRITGDCPFIRSAIISKHITLADAAPYDYVSNVWEKFRTAKDGDDCEVISSRLLKWAVETAVSPHDREHVTTLIRREPPSWARLGAVVNDHDESDVKMSIDTLEDLERAERVAGSAADKIRAATLELGTTSVHRY